MAAHSGGSLGDLSTLDDLPFVESLGCEDSSGGVAVVGLHFRKQFCTSQRLEHLKKEKLKTVRDSCRWASSTTPPVLGTKLPPIPASGEWREKQMMMMVRSKQRAETEDCLTCLSVCSQGPSWRVQWVVVRCPSLVPAWVI